MTYSEAQKQILKAMDTIKSVRDTLGAQLTEAHTKPDQRNGEIRLITELHDRLACAISAYNGGNSR